MRIIEKSAHKYIRERRRQFPTVASSISSIIQVYQGEKTTIPNDNSAQCKSQTSISGREDDNSQLEHAHDGERYKYIRERRRQFPTTPHAVSPQSQVYQGEKTTIPNVRSWGIDTVASISGREDDNSQPSMGCYQRDSKYIRERRRQFPTKNERIVGTVQVYQGEKTTIPNADAMHR